MFGFYDDEEEAVAAYARAVFNYKGKGGKTCTQTT